MRSVKVIIVCLLQLVFGLAKAQTQAPQFQTDTLHLTLNSAESMFLQNNFQLLAQRYSIDSAKAEVIQARLYPNPNFAYERGPVIPINDPNSQYPHSNFFSHSENAGNVSQLILLAGKRNKQIKIAQANVTLTEYQFFDLLRTLKYTLRTDFYNIYYLQQSAKVYNEEINSLQVVINAYNQLQGKGYISEKEVVRVKAQLYSLQSEYNDLLNQVNDQQAELKLILQAKPVNYIDPLADSAAIESLDPGKYALSTLMDSAYHNRTDLQIAITNASISELNYNYQKALAVPDLTLALSYDEQGSYAHNFNSVGASIDLPFFNRNQGNIKAARATIENTGLIQKSTQATVEQNVARALEKAFAEDRLYKNIDPKFAGDFERLMHEVLINYQRRNLGLLDFLDFYDSYKQNILQQNSIKFNRISALEDINYYTGTPFFN